VPIILFLNKVDLFREKITRKPISVHFKDYRGPQSFEDSAKYIRSRFLALAGPATSVVVHYTCAIDTDSVRAVWGAVRDDVCRHMLEAMF